ncbi:hypothetical protein Q3G72_003495 [Acer saccharum]|nr:hypothetical protein Q3G72_003495 [Acer saccharum]
MHPIQMDFVFVNLTRIINRNARFSVHPMQASIGTLTLVYDVNMGQYRPLGAEMQQMEISGHFRLDSDEDKIREEDNLAKLNVEVGVNGHGLRSEVNGSV